MEYGTLDLTLISAKGLTKAGKLNVYAVASIFDSRKVINNVQKFKTPIDKDNGSNPTWNFPMKFTVNEGAGLLNRLTLVVKIKGARMFLDKNLGEVRVPIKELLQGVKPEGKTMRNVRYLVRGRYGKVKGVLSFSYEFGEKTFGKSVRSSSAHRPRVVSGAGGHTSSGSGIGMGFLGGLLISEVANSTGYGGGEGGCGGDGVAAGLWRWWWLWWREWWRLWRLQLR